MKGVIVTGHEELRVKATFDAALAKSGSLSALARDSGASYATIQTWQRHHRAGRIWTGQAWEFPSEPVEEATTLAVRLKAHLKSKTGHQTIESMADHFNCPPREIREALAALESGAVLLSVQDDAVALERDLEKHEAPVAIDFTKYAEQEFAVGFTADNHLGSKYERLDVLEALYDRFAAEGVRTVYQGGNIIEGEAPFNKFDIYARGVEGQVSNLVEKWPRRKGITTEFVTGDDHEGWYVQREHINIGKKIEQDAYLAGRDDLRHLGYMERDVEYAQEGGAARVRVIHAGGGSSYAVSYTSQKYVESLQGGEKPQLILVGHFHKFNYAFEREVHVIQMGCTEDQTPFMRKKRLRADVGGGIAWITQNALGVFTSVKVQWFPFYDKRFYQYRW